MPATLAALGPHKILELSNLFVEAIDVLVKESKEKKVLAKESSVSISHDGHLW